MSLEIALQFQKNPQSTKFLILKVLILHPYSKNSEIQQYLKKYYNRQISFQAVKQALSELYDENVLQNEERKYAIHPEWVLELKEFLKFMDEARFTTQFKYLLDDSTRHITLQSLEELGYFVFYNLDLHIKEKGDLLFYLNNLWIPFGATTIRNKLSNILKRTNGNVYIKENTTGDKILSYWYKKRGKVVLNHKFSSQFQYIIFDDLVMQIYMNSDLLDQFKKAYSFRRNLLKNVLENLIELTFGKYSIEVTLIKSESLANELKNKIRNN